MIIVVEQYNISRFKELVEEMFRLRARVFRDRLSWDVQVVDGMERDKYDEQGPVYLIYTDDKAREVKGSLRLLPTTGPTLLQDFFPDTLPPAANLSAPTIWECTRLCLDDKLMSRGNRDELLFASATLMAGLGEVAINAGIETILGNFDSTMLRLYRQVGCEVEVLGLTHRYGRAVYLGSFAVSEATVHRLKRWPNKKRREVDLSLDNRVLAA